MSGIFKPALAGNTNIYEVNIRQFTEEGTFSAFAGHLPRLHGMGVEILWLMPIHPIGMQNRKGSLGSYYAIRDHRGVNPEFGTAEDLRHLIAEAHASGMKVILDWVANHAAPDHVWTVAHPEYFERDGKGHFISPYDWTDVIQIDHKHEGQQAAMRSAMEYWVREFDIDGFRADLAHLTPLPFWYEARRCLEKVKPGLIWLAETEDHGYHDCFDISFTWKWMHACESVCKGKATLSSLVHVLDEYKREFPPQAYRLYFTSNHDENSWNGTEFDKYGPYASLLAIFSFTYASIPLLYSGQEIPNRKRLEFFEKDAIDRSVGYQLEPFYRELFLLRKENPALHNNDNTSDIPLFIFDDRAMMYVRHSGDSVVITALNFSDKEIAVSMEHHLFHGTFVNLFTSEERELHNAIQVTLDPAGYLVLKK